MLEALKPLNWLFETQTELQSHNDSTKNTELLLEVKKSLQDILGSLALANLQTTSAALLHIHMQVCPKQHVANVNFSAHRHALLQKLQELFSILPIDV